MGRSTSILSPRRRVGLAVCAVVSVVSLLSLTLLSPALVRSQDLEAVDEMRLQAERFADQGRACAAAERYRALVGAIPELFRRYAESRAACLSEQAPEATQPIDDANR